MDNDDHTQQHDKQGKFTTTHGADAGIKSLTSGAELRGLAAESQRTVETELVTEGRAAIVERAAVRLEAVARLFYNAILSATEQKDFEKLALYAQRYGWLQARALAAWAQLKQEQKDGDDGKQTLDALLGKDANND